MCGEQRVLALDNHYAKADQEWRYLHGEVRCADARTLSYERFSDPAIIEFSSGWSSLENGGGMWNGRWSDGATSTITIPIPSGKTVVGVKLVGHYFEKNSRTRVIIDGEDLGWHKLTGVSAIPLRNVKQKLKIELRHEFPHAPPPVAKYPDGRNLALFLQAIVIYTQ